MAPEYSTEGYAYGRVRITLIVVRLCVTRPTLNAAGMGAPNFIVVYDGYLVTNEPGYYAVGPRPRYRGRGDGKAMDPGSGSGYLDLDLSG